MSKTILVVDDEPVILEISKRMLEKRGYQVFVATNGKEALSQLQSKIPDLIILDIQMPEMNGYTFIMEKAKTPAFVDIPVVVLTAHYETEPLFKRYGVKEYLLKPLQPQALMDKVVEIIGLSA